MDGPTTLRNKACSYLQASSHLLQEADRVYIAILAFGNRERDKGPFGSSLGIQIIFEHRPSRAAIRLTAISNFVPSVAAAPCHLSRRACALLLVGLDGKTRNNMAARRAKESLL